MRKALLIGINAYPDAPLQGCVNDETDLKALLKTSFGFANTGNEIRMLDQKRATKKTILSELRRLVNSLKSGDYGIFHYSGHGVQVPTQHPNGELDGLDEAICPINFDFTEATIIRDKEFKAIFDTIADGAVLYWISDSCHSGDLSREISLDDLRTFPLTAKAALENYQAERSEKAVVPLNTVNERVVFVAGCKSDQTSADAYFNGRANGAFTYHFIEQLKETPEKTLGSIVFLTKERLKKAGFGQEPQIEGSAVLMKRPLFGY